MRSRLLSGRAGKKQRLSLKTCHFLRTHSAGIRIFDVSINLYSSEREISFARNKIGAAAMSSRDLIKDKDGNELPELSRRVEFRHVFDDRKYLLTVQNYLQSQN